MIVDIYRCKKKEGLYLFVARGRDTSELPEELLKQIGKLHLCMSMNLAQRTELARISSAVVEENINVHGFYLQMPPKPSEDLTSQLVEKNPYLNG
ncbi:MAG: hypothetical protein COA42_00030 [Alteromonadaceae bacterium]|nr:MAG: hypothetical protein COA42_00030 [Alteromonadaceae bacterium]